MAHQTPKRQRTEETNNIEIELPNDCTKFLVVAGTDEDLPMRKVSPMKGNLILKGLVGTVDKVIRLQNGDLIVGVRRAGQVKSLLGTTLFGSAPVRVTLHRTMNCKKGVIRCSALKDIEEDEIVEGLREDGVTDARKIYFSREGKKVPSATVILTFGRSTLPKEIKAGYLNIKVDPYIPNPLRCFQCNRFGHPKDRCKRDATCGRCGSSEHADDRQCQLTPRCVNCDGEHSSFSKDCPKWKEEKEIQRIKITQNISFQQARQQVVPTPAPGRLFTDAVKRVMTSDFCGQTDLDELGKQAPWPWSPNTSGTQEIIPPTQQPENINKNRDNHQQSKPNNNSKDISSNYLTKTQKKKEKKKQQQQKNLVGSSCEEALGALQELEDMDTCLPSSPHKEKQLDRGPRSPIKAPRT